MPQSMLGGGTIGAGRNATAWQQEAGPRGQVHQGRVLQHTPYLACPFPSLICPLPGCAPEHSVVSLAFWAGIGTYRRISSKLRAWKPHDASLPHLDALCSHALWSSVSWIYLVSPTQQVQLPAIMLPHQLNSLFVLHHQVSPTWQLIECAIS